MAHTFYIIYYLHFQISCCRNYNFIKLNILFLFCFRFVSFNVNFKERINIIIIGIITRINYIYIILNPAEVNSIVRSSGTTPHTYINIILIMLYSCIILSILVNRKIYRIIIHTQVDKNIIIVYLYLIHFTICCILFNSLFFLVGIFGNVSNSFISC